MRSTKVKFTSLLQVVKLNDLISLILINTSFPVSYFILEIKFQKRNILLFGVRKQLGRWPKLMILLFFLFSKLNKKDLKIQDANLKYPNDNFDFLNSRGLVVTESCRFDLDLYWIDLELTFWRKSFWIEFFKKSLTFF